MILRYAVFTMFVVLIVSGCGDPDSTEIAQPVVPIDDPFYFDVYFTNPMGNFKLLGTYVDSQGNIVSYDHSFGPWSIASPLSITVAELDEKFSAPTDTIGVVDPVTLAKMYGKVEAASQGDLIGSGYTGEGPGVFTYGCHVFDKEADGYVQVLFGRIGDFPRTNSSQEAQDLVVWLDSIVPQLDDGS